MFTTKKLAWFQFIALVVMLALGVVGHVLDLVSGLAGYIFYILLCIGGTLVTIVAVGQIIVGITEKQAWGIIAGVMSLLAWTFAAPGIAGLIVGSIFTVLALVLNYFVAKDSKHLKPIKM